MDYFIETITDRHQQGIVGDYVLEIATALVRLARADVAVADEQLRAKVWSDEQDAELKAIFDTPESIEQREALATFLSEVKP